MAKSYNRKPNRKGREAKEHAHHRYATTTPDFGTCDCCGQFLPICKETGMCYPCTTGDASTLYGDL